MGYNKAGMAFVDVREAFERALRAPRGIKISCNTRSEAIVLRSRFNYYRKLDRTKNSQTYESDHPLYGQSVYDALVLRVPAKGSEDQNVLFIQPRSVEDFNIEEISA